MNLLCNWRYSTEVTAEELKARTLEILDRHGVDYDISWTLSGLPFLTPVGELVNAAKTAILNVTGLKLNYRLRAVPQMAALLPLPAHRYWNLAY